MKILFVIICISWIIFCTTDIHAATIEKKDVTITINTDRTIDVVEKVYY